MFVQQEHYFWEMVHELVVQYHFDILHIHSKEQGVWLERKAKWKTHVIRLKHKQINWRNELKKELFITAQQIRQNPRLFRGKQVVLHTLFISEHPPVEDWQDIQEEIPLKRLKLELYYLSDERKETEHKRFLNQFMIEKPFKETALSSEEKEEMIPYLKKQIVTYHKSKNEEEKALFQNGNPFVTYILLGLNLLMFAVLEFNGGSTSIQTLIDYGAKYNPAIIEGAWWRILSSMFLHIGILHLFMNMLALYYVGTAVERIYGTWRFTGIYFLAGVFGGTASFMLNPHVAAGASGAIFGLFGALLFFGIQHKRLFFRTMGWNLIFVIGLNIAFGILVPQVDNGAHLGGLAGGFLASFVFHLPRKKSLFKQVGAFILYVSLVLTMGFLGINSVFNNTKAYFDIQETQKLNQQGDYDETISVVEQALVDPGQFEAELRFNRSFAYLKNGEVDKAEKDLLKVISIAPEMASAHYNLAILYNQSGELDKAAKYAAAAADLQPENEDFQKFAEELADH